SSATNGSPATSLSGHLSRYIGWNVQPTCSTSDCTRSYTLTKLASDVPSLMSIDSVPLLASATRFAQEANSTLLLLPPGLIELSSHFCCASAGFASSANASAPNRVPRCFMRSSSCLGLLLHRRRQPHADDRKQHQYDDFHDIGGDEGEHALEDGRHGDVRRQSFQHEHVDAEGRRERAHL